MRKVLSALRMPTEMFWFRVLTLLILLHPSTSAKDTTEVTGAVGGSVTFRIQNPGGKAAVWTFGNARIATVLLRDPPIAAFAEDKYESRFAVSEGGHALSISRLSLEDAGTYSVRIAGKISTFTLRVLTSTSNPTEVIRAVGGSVTFRIQNPIGKAAVWHFGNVHIVTVQLQDPPVTLFSKDKYERCVSISENGNALTLSQLSLEDAGTYSVSMSGTMSTFILQVYRELPEPTVTYEAQNYSEDGSCRFSLRCSAPGTDLGYVSYAWSRGNLPWGEGPTVWVERSAQDELEPLMCTARNPVSSRNVTVTTPGELCAAPRSGSLARVMAVAVAEAAALSSIFLLFHCRAARLSSSGG